MSNDLFPGFETKWIDIDAGRFFARIGGEADAPPVVLLHGFPQTHAEWHKVAPGLAANHRVVCLDLKGYGRSDAPAGDPEHTSYSKRTMGREVLAIMEKLGHRKFSVIGHDRGALVAYRIALDHPERVDRLAILDNLPTFVLWDLIDADPGFIVHWRTMSQPAPHPEELMDSTFMENMLRSHTANRSLDCFDSAALQDFRESWNQPSRVHAFCEDYRAGAVADPLADRIDFQAMRKITLPTLILWGAEFLGKAAESPLDTWRRTFAPRAHGVEVPGGHFNAEESPAETLDALNRFLLDRFRRS